MLLWAFGCGVENAKVSTLDLVSLEIESSRSSCGKSTEVRCADNLWYIDKSAPFLDLKYKIHQNLIDSTGLSFEREFYNFSY